MNDRMIKKILVPTDFSKLSMVALEYAEILLELQTPKIYLLHVLDKSTMRKEAKGKKRTDKNFAAIEKVAMKQLSTIAGQYFTETHVVTMALRKGDPSREIVKLAQEEKVDLIIISTHGRTGIAHVLMGSVAERVVRYSPIPVLSVKPARMQMKLMEESDIDEQLHLKPAGNK
jgi:nucleotide-binding universal stress UspA family protein